ncbi:MAG: hypothetical protein ACSLEM_05155 [Candidatus Malihini olakiniferum]
MNTGVVTTWRQLSGTQRTAVTDAKAPAHYCWQPNTFLIKRSPLTNSERALLGFNAESYHAFTAEKE